MSTVVSLFHVTKLLLKGLIPMKKIDRKKLVLALGRAYPGVGGSETRPAFQCFTFEKSRVITGDGVGLITVALEESPELECKLYAQQFLQLLKSLPGDYITVETKGSNVIVKTDEGRVKGTFNTVEDAVEFRMLEIKEGKLTEEVLADLFDGLAFCKYHVCTDLASGQLCGVHVRGKHILSTDLYRIIRYTMSEEVLVPCTIPVEFITALLKHKAVIDNLYVQDDLLVAVRSDGVVMYSALMGGEYPDIAASLPSRDTEFAYVKFRDDLKPALTRHIKFLTGASSGNRYIKVTVAGKTCSIESSDTEVGRLEEVLELDTEEDFEEFSFYIDPSFWLDICTLCNSFNYAEGQIMFLTDKIEYLCNESVKVR
jgi:DNA polymerase III sliding clamp (beta) subunit (PCNA family)